MDFSVLMSVYKKDKAEDVKEAIHSVSIRQTIPPNEVVLVVDGPVPIELGSMIQAISKDIPYIRPIWLAENKGLGIALQTGLLECKYGLVARMDSDDIASPKRFEKQLALFENDAKLGLAGSFISEFIDKPTNIVSHRIVPTTDKEIRCYMKKRCPFNHMTVMYKRSEVLKAGNYLDWYWNEDYYLWIRMMLAGCKFANLEENLVNVRVGKDMYARRGSMKYFKSEVGIQYFMLKNDIISLPLYCFNVLVRFVVQVVMPNKLRGCIFQKFFRQQ